MKTLHCFVIVALLFASSCSGVAAAQTPTTAGTITKVTVYRGQALVTRAVEIDLPADVTELIVHNLPENIVPESIYAQASDGAKVLSVRYRQRAVREDTREEVKVLDTQIETLARTLTHLESHLEHAKSQWQMFEKLRDFTVVAADSDLDRGLLTFDPIKSLAQFIETEGTEYLTSRLELEDKITDLKKEQELLDRKRKELMAGHSRTEREAVLFVSRTAGRKLSLELNYLVNGANWQQQYNLRADPADATVLIEYNAVVNQTSGEHWDSVELSLSTAEPSMVAAAPTLDPMLVGLSSPAVAQVPQQYQPIAAQDQIRRLQQSRKDFGKKGFAANTELNELAVQNQVFFFNARQQEVEEYQKQMADILRTEGVSVTYDLPGRLTLPSRSDQQLVTIDAITAKADFILVATPLLTDYVYLQAEIFNGSETVLLPGPASMFRNGEFVGRSQVPLVTMRERFTAGFGIDSQIRVRHELDQKTTRIQGGNRIDTYHYRIALSNYKDSAVELRLLDRLPYSEDPSIKIELSETQPDLSPDAEYVRALRKKGILRWDLTLQPNTLDQTATIVTYSFTMEYDRNMQIQPRRSQNQ